MRDLWYGVDGKPIGDMREVERLLGDHAARRVALTIITTDRGQCQVSTMHLVLDHGWGHRAAPVLWETMTFGGPDDQSQERYQSLADARKGHDEAATACLSFLDIEGAKIVAVERIDGAANVSGADTATPVSHRADTVTQPRDE